MRAGTRGVLGAAAALAIAACAAPGAWAGTYDVVACNAPGAGGMNNSWSWEVGALDNNPTDADRANYALGGSCSSPGGQRGFSNPGSRTARWGTFANFIFRAPAGTDITRVTLWRYGTGTQGTDDPNTPENESGRFEVSAQYGASQLFYDTCHPGEGFWPNPCHTGAPGYSDASRIVYDGRADQFTVGIFCGGGTTLPSCSTHDGAGNPYGELDFQGAAVRLEDTSSPRIKAGGPLYSGGWRRPSDTVSLDTADNSGIRAARLEADGHVVSSRSFRCDRTRPVPCRGNANGTTFTGAGLGDGTHAVRVVSEDAAGNRGVVARTVQTDGTPPTAVLERAKGRRIVLSVSDAASGVASAALEVRNRASEQYRALGSTLANGKLRATLDRGRASRVDMRVTVRDTAGNVTQGNPTRLAVTSARIGRRSRRVRSGRVKVPFGRRARLRGRLSFSGGQAFAGQTISATSTIRRHGARSQFAGTATTDRRGRFSLAVPAGPSRTYRVVFNGAGGALGAARGVSVRVPASSTIRASRTRLFGAARVRFHGRLRTRGQRIPGRGLVLVLQGRERGRWRTFEDTRTDRKGRWHVAYVFSGRPGRYPIRVRIRKQAGYPFELGYSRALTVRVG
jgi:hypothetical protein